MSGKKLKNGCIPARRKISSGGKTGSYASARTGGKQAHSALMQKRPPGSNDGYFKNAVCCHKCPNDRSAPNGYVCINPAHLCWGTKGDNTVDQHHGNGTACGKPKNENEIRSDVRAYAYDLLKEKTRGVIRLSIKDLKSLIFEEVGSAYFGDSFLEFKKKTEQGEFAFDVLRDMGAKVKYVGEGSTRFVYQFKDNPDIVIKIINWPKGRNPEDKVWSGFKKSHMIDSNKWESDLLIQQRYADVFPRTFEVAKDYTWILSEMVDPVKHYGELFDIMGIDNSILQKKDFFVQINTGNEEQKSGVSLSNAEKFLEACKNNEIQVDGLMCLPPINEPPARHFQIMQSLANNNHIKYLSMGMSDDYEIALQFGSTHIRVGTAIFGQRD